MWNRCTLCKTATSFNIHILQPLQLGAQITDSIQLSNASLYYEIKGEGLPGARASRTEREYMERLQDSMARAESPSASVTYRKIGKQFLRLISYDATRIDSIFEEVSKSRTNMPMQFLMIQDLRKMNYNVKSKIALLNFPTLVICGRQDPIGLFPSIQLKELNNKFNLVRIERSRISHGSKSMNRFTGRYLSFYCSRV